MEWPLSRPWLLRNRIADLRFFHAIQIQLDQFLCRPPSPSNSSSPYSRLMDSTFPPLPTPMFLSKCCRNDRPHLLFCRKSSFLTSRNQAMSVLSLLGLRLYFSERLFLLQLNLLAVLQHSRQTVTGN